MFRSIAAILLGSATSAVALAQDAHHFECTMADLVRRIEIFYEPGQAVPCEVRYMKETEAPGATEVLWSAQSESGYCEARTAEFVGRLESLGWQCSQSSGPAPRADADAAEDDTAVLSAPE